jgi:hypothetical protein
VIDLHRHLLPALEVPFRGLGQDLLDAAAAQLVRGVREADATRLVEDTPRALLTDGLSF